MKGKYVRNTGIALLLGGLFIVGGAKNDFKFRSYSVEIPDNPISSLGLPPNKLQPGPKGRSEVPKKNESLYNFGWVAFGLGSIMALYGSSRLGDEKNKEREKQEYAMQQLQQDATQQCKQQKRNKWESPYR